MIKKENFPLNKMLAFERRKREKHTHTHVIQYAHTEQQQCCFSQSTICADHCSRQIRLVCVEKSGCTNI